MQSLHQPHPPGCKTKHLWQRDIPPTAPSGRAPERGLSWPVCSLPPAKQTNSEKIVQDGKKTTMIFADDRLACSQSLLLHLLVKQFDHPPCEEWLELL
jgi:hypothetical protein